MKCVCGYEYKAPTYKYDKVKKDWKELTKGTEAFREVIKISDESIYACPKCGTLKIEA